MVITSNKTTKRSCWSTALTCALTAVQMFQIGVSYKSSSYLVICLLKYSTFGVVSSANVCLDASELSFPSAGVLMVLAWVFFAATGTSLARYLKRTDSFLTRRTLLGAQLWFRVNFFGAGLQQCCKEENLTAQLSHLGTRFMREAPLSLPQKFTTCPTWVLRACSFACRFTRC